MSIGGVRIVLSERESPVFGGTEFGTVGRYERLHGGWRARWSRSNSLTCIGTWLAA
jgi:hypothetical protein